MTDQELASTLADAALAAVVALTSLQAMRRQSSLPSSCVLATGPAPEVPGLADAPAGF